MNKPETLPPVVVRRATEHDLRDVLALYAQPLLDDGDVLELEEAREVFAAFNRYPSYTLYVAAVERLVVGTYALLIMDNLAHRGARSAVAEDIAVAPAFQGHGVGSVMMEHARARSREARCYKLVLSSNEKRTQAHGFYCKLGFARHGYSFRVEP